MRPVVPAPACGSPPTGVAGPHADQEPSRRRTARLAQPRRIAGVDRSVPLAVDPREDRRSGRTGERRATGDVRRSLAADVLAHRRCAGPPGAQRRPTLEAMTGGSPRTPAPDACTGW